MQHPLDDATAATVQRCKCARHTPLQVEREERVIEPIKWMGIIRRPSLTRAVWQLANNPGYTPTLYEKSARHGIFNDQESQDLGFMSHPKDGAF